MFWRIASHEVAYRFRKGSTHVYFLLFFALSYLFVNAAGGAFGSGVVIFGGSGPNTTINSPYVLAVTIGALSLFGVIITAAFMGQTIYRDYDSGMDPLLFTTPVKKRDYLGGRFAGALLVNLYIFASFGLGLMLGEVTPWLDADPFGPFRLIGYVQPYVLFVIPNLVFTGALFFALSATTRKMLPNYIGGILLFMGYNLASLLVSADAIENSRVATLLDPFGFITFQQVTRYWTAAQQNTQVPALAGMMLWNRLLWVALGLTAFGVLYARFRFSHGSEGRRIWQPSWRPSWLGGKTADAEASGTPEAAAQPSVLINHLQLPAVTRSYTLGSRLRQYAALTKRAFLEIVRDVYFYAILAAGVLFLIIGADQVGRLYGTTVYPVTRIVADSLAGQFTLFVIILIAFYAGRLVWRERDLGISQIHDALPLSGGTFFIAKLTALIGMVVLLIGVVMVAGIGTQATYGYFQFEIGVYLKMLFGVQLLKYALFCVLALTIHTVVNHKYTGHFLIVLYFVGVGFLSQLGLEHRLWRFSSGVSMPYSDMNGFGHFIDRFSWMALHWSLVAALMAVAARLLWVRGTDASLKARFQHVRRRFSPRVAFTAAALGLAALCTGAFVVYNTNGLHTYRTSEEQKALRAEYEKTYKKYDGRPQPRITAVDVNVKLYPARRDADIRGRYRLRNKTGAPIDSVQIQLSGGDNNVHMLSFSRPAQAVLTDSVQHVRIYRLARPLRPGDTLSMHFEQAMVTKGFQNSGSNTQLVHDGTFLTSGALPRLGYVEDRELSDPDDREDYDLPPRPRMKALGDTSAYGNTYISSDADWIDFDATVSTSSGQRAFAPGALLRSWKTDDGRRHFHYRARAPMLNFYTFVSGRYNEAHDTWQPSDSSSHAPVKLSVYYDPKHGYNVDRMMHAAKRSLTYYSKNFGPYQNDYLRIMEFPRYRGAFAQSFLGTVPFSESMGFILRVDDEHDINFPFYVTAHEVSHQWWAHQIIGADVQGSTMLSETLAQYSALMVMKQAYGPKTVRHFLQYELDNYLRGRSAEQRKELPLMRVENQQYIHYRKGAMVMYALQDYMGEDRLNHALAQFVKDDKFTQPPYPTSRDLVGYIQRAAPDSLQPVIDDFFRKIILYGNRATNATYEKTDGGRYRVHLTVKGKKVRADSLGNETEVDMGDWIDVGVFTKATGDDDLGTPLYLKKRRIESGEQTITVTVDEKPARAGIDPYRKLIDRDTGDNVTRVTQAGDGG